ncbi:MAG: sensor histidine kinase [Lachnospiraceae bacterium]|nr:sensor histidine kinase [Lachnospiraceae bacterium]
MSAFEISATIIEAVIQYGFLGIMLIPKKHGLPYRLMALIICVGINSACVGILDHLQSFTTFDVVIYILMDMFVAELFFKGPHFEKLSKVLLLELAISLSALATMLLMPVISSAEIAETIIRNDSDIRVFSLSLAKTVQFLLSLAFFLSVHKLEKKYHVKNWVPEGTVMLFVTLCSDLGIAIIGNENETVRRILFFCFIILLLIFSFISLSFVLYMYNKEKENYELNSFLIKTDYEMSRLTEIEESKKELRSLRHEIRNSFLPIQELLKQKQLDEAKRQLDEVINETEESLKNENLIDSGYILINAVLMHYLSIFKENDYVVSLRIEKIFLGSISERVIASILVNLLQNSEEAMKKHGTNNIEMDLYNEESFLYIRVKNGISESVAKNVVSEESNKDDKTNHGFGLKAIKKHVKNMNGIYRNFEENDCFTSEIIIPLSTVYDGNPTVCAKPVD